MVQEYHDKSKGFKLEGTFLITSRVEYLFLFTFSNDITTGVGGAHNKEGGLALTDTFLRFALTVLGSSCTVREASLNFSVNDCTEANQRRF